MTYQLNDIRNTIPKHKTRKWSKQTSVKRIGVHATASDNQDPNRTALYHVTPSSQNHISAQGAPGLCYHDFIDKAGLVYHCNDYDNIVWHWGMWNTNSVGVVLAYKGAAKEVPPDVMMESLKEHLVVLCLYLKVYPENIFGHREVPSMYTVLADGTRRYKKTCPGMGIDLDVLRDSVTRMLQTRLTEEGLYDGDIDGLFWDQSKSALDSFEVPDSESTPFTG